ncbi:methyltransferase domain-containing protein [Flavobacterium sp. NRK F10]|uniref:SAM-dependent methyltransferase n=1 Tax=Flavobacterium sediminis TaxID=2201181 RepID=A0A2U8QRM7_9FLAO|nr:MULTISPECIES: methyltransferase domain-containing protein [Flavobacterium]AWM12813.1 SAM-dependent methyltransferase [Flavobacterium sediminis]MCO6173940.1 methyltransferase domain-containing protein [Flavobacterium sp. NRK F10]
MNLNSDYWENRYLNNDIGWDTGGITTPLKEYIDQIDNKELKILIPGAGNGHEFNYLIQNGFRNTFVVDLAPTPLKRISDLHPDYSHQIIQGNFFDHQGQYDLILEQTFFCALNPDLRKDYVSKMHSLLNQNGKIAGLLFQFPLTEDGPPFGGSKEEYLDLFCNHFMIKTLENANNSIKPRAGRELFIIFEKNNRTT